MKTIQEMASEAGISSAVGKYIALDSELEAFAALVREEAQRKPMDGVLVPLNVLEAAEESLGSFCSDHGWSDKDMQNMDNLSAYIAQHKAAHGIKE